MRAALLIGIVCIMTSKPGADLSLTTMAAATAAGLLASLPGFRQRAQPESVEGP
jgi:hypothetical protein